jgi:hypothetical protein
MLKLSGVRGAGIAAVMVSLACAAASPAAQADPVVAAAGDIACDPVSSTGDPNPKFNGGQGTGMSDCHEQYTSDLLLSGGLVRPEITAVLTLGDIQYEDGAYCKYVGGVQAAAAGFSCPLMANGQPMPASYDPSWGRVKGVTRPVLGNHEYGSGSATPYEIGADSGAKGYFTYFGGVLGGLGQSSATSASKGYYSYDVPVGAGRWHFIALNSECAAGLADQVGWTGGCAAGSAQETWLKQDLQNHPTDCTVAYWHHPLFSSGGIGNNPSVKPLWDDLYAAGADVVFNGHDHDYERFAPQDPSAKADARGMREFIVGTGGKSELGKGTTKPNSVVFSNTTFGELELTMHPVDATHPHGSYDWAFRNDGASGTSFTDTGSADCVVAPTFTLSATPTTKTVARGSSARYSVAVSPQDGFAGQVTLSANGLPTSSSAAFSPNPTGSSSTLTITTRPKTKPGTYPITITGLSGGLTRTTQVTLAVR